MSELKDILTDSQLVKHYQVMQYLSKHPNEAFTLAQLDYLLPRGASLQRFPEEWTTAMRDGAGSSRSVELVDAEQDGDAPPTASASDVAAQAAEYLMQRAQRVMLVCRRPEVQSLAALSVVLQSPSAQLDAEACVAVHTDQILLPQTLLRDAQRAGLAYYFPDNYNKSDLRVHTVGGADGAGSRNNAPTAVPDNLAEASESCVYPALPPGLRLHHELFTIRGLRMTEDHAIPVRLHVGERLFLVIDNVNAVEKRLGRQHQVSSLKVDYLVRSDGSSTGPATTTTSGESPFVIEVKQRAVHSSSSSSSTATASEARPTKVVMSIVPVHAAAAVKLILSFPNYLDDMGASLPPCVVNMRVLDEPTDTPGVLIGRDRQPVTFSIPERFLLQDPVVNPPPLLGTGHTSASQAGGDGDDVDSTEAHPNESLLSSLPLPWWESSSPLVRSVRDQAYPSQEQVKIAEERVFSAVALSAVARQQVALLKLQQSNAAATRRKRTRSRANINLTNRHLIHFGLDTSVPCSPDGRS